jgi:glyoxylase-like metal-dependent hydrolase (beta-lactamase superfamily II)
MLHDVHGWRFDVLSTGLPGRSLEHGYLGWSTITLLRGHGRTIVLDGGALGARALVAGRLRALGVGLGEVTDVVVSHAHFDHVVNWPMFPSAAVWIGAAELAWAQAQPAGDPLVPEAYVSALSRSPRVRQAVDGEELAPGVRGIVLPGHTPGHLTLEVCGGATAVLLAGDAAKNRAELVERSAVTAVDPDESTRSIDWIWSWADRHDEAIVVPGHDRAVRLESGTAVAVMPPAPDVIEAWYGGRLTEITEVKLR